MSDEARQRVSRETLDIYAPLAHRLGVYWMKEELEEAAFSELYPDIHARIEALIEGSIEERRSYIEQVKDELSQTLQEQGLRAEVTGRTKEIYSLYKKMQDQDVELDQIYDLTAFRVIVDAAPASCYEVLGTVHGLWKPVPGRVKDYIAMPKPNGYQSLHTTLIGPFGERMEVQIRTQEMHRVSEFGIAAHWKYKDGEPIDENSAQQFAWLRQLLEWQQQLQDPNEFLETVRVDLFSDEVYVFTPRGEVIALPAGASPIDFAYSVHSEVGDHCAGAKVNGKLVPLRSKLLNGDTVEIVTSPHLKPRQEWLDHVVTGRARNRIRHFLKEAQVEHARKLGQEILERDLRRRGRAYDKLQKAGEITRVASELSYKTLDALLQAIAYGRCDTRQVIAKLGVPEEEKPPSLFERVFPSRRGNPGVRVGGMDRVLVRFGQCCSPVPGDPVEGFITRGRGVTVHTRDCPKIFHLDPERRVPVTWEDERSDQYHRVKLRVTSEDRPGLLAEITDKISGEGINIRGGQIETSVANRAVQTFELGVRDRKHLDTVIRQISKVRGVLSVERLRS